MINFAFSFPSGNEAIWHSCRTWKEEGRLAKGLLQTGNAKYFVFLLLPSLSLSCCKRQRIMRNIYSALIIRLDKEASRKEEEEDEPATQHGVMMMLLMILCRFAFDFPTSQQPDILKRIHKAETHLLRCRCWPQRWAGASTHQRPPSSARKCEEVANVRRANAPFCEFFFNFSAERSH